jgi:hypothetical protein
MGRFAENTTVDNGHSQMIYVRSMAVGDLSAVKKIAQI